MSESSPPLPLVTPAERASFAEDGVVCLRGHFGDDWLVPLREATDRVLAERKLTLDYTLAGAPGRYVSGLFMWLTHPVFRDFALRSPAAAIAGELMGASRIHLFFDHLLIKEPGTPDPTHWHHDLPFWPVLGEQVCSLWLALDHVTRDSGGVQFVAGSHRWPVRYRPIEPYTPELWRKRNMDLPECPSFFSGAGESGGGESGEHRILSWDLEPGDCVVFTALTIHGSTGNASSTERRRGFATRWCGDGVTFIDDPHVLDLPWSPGLATGEPLGGALFPEVWRRGE
ncbi:MAG: phytanoyl-CoA dioxygenase family protein [Polyangiaceae bacterium]